MEGLLALYDTFNSGWDNIGEARGKECEQIARGGSVPSHAFGDAAASGAPNMAASAFEAAGNVPGTSMTGPPVGAATSPSSAIRDAAKVANLANNLHRSNQISNAATQFGGLKNAMTGMGYKFVPNHNTRFGGYFRRPPGSQLPSPRSVNDALNCD